MCFLDTCFLNIKVQSFPWLVSRAPFLDPESMQDFKIPGGWGVGGSACEGKIGERHDRHFHRKITLKEAQAWRPTALENYFYSLEKSRSHPCGRINELEDLGKASWSSLELSLEGGCDLNKHRSLGRTVTWEAHLEQKLWSGCPSGRHLSNRGLEMP